MSFQKFKKILRKSIDKAQNFSDLFQIVINQIYQNGVQDGQKAAVDGILDIIADAAPFGLFKQLKK